MSAHASYGVGKPLLIDLQLRAVSATKRLNNGECETFADYLTAFRERKLFSIAAFADACGLDHSYISRLEGRGAKKRDAGRPAKPSAVTIHVLLEPLHLSPFEYHMMLTLAGYSAVQEWTELHEYIEMALSVMSDDTARMEFVTTMKQVVWHWSQHGS